MSYGTIQIEKMTTESGYSLGAGNASSFKNRIINGAMVIDQRNNGASVTTTSGGGYFYSVDRFITYNLVGVNFTTQRVAEAPAGFTFSNKLTFANAFSLTTTGEATLQQVIEGFNIADLGWGTASAQSITVRFWVRSSFTGTFSVGIANTNGTRAYATTYTVNAANTWEQKSVTIPGDTSGTWATDNSAGMFLRFMLASGSNFVVSANNAWTTRAGSYNGTDSIYGTRAIGAATGISAGATWQITGVQLEVGTVATSFDFRSYGTELALCQRYYQTNMAAVGGAGSTTQCAQVIPLVQQMRSTPTLTLINGVSALDELYTARRNISSLGGTWGENDTTRSIGVLCNTTGLTNQRMVTLQAGFIALSAEL